MERGAVEGRVGWGETPRRGFWGRGLGDSDLSDADDSDLSDLDDSDLSDADDSDLSDADDSDLSDVLELVI